MYIIFIFILYLYLRRRSLLPFNVNVTVIIISTAARMSKGKTLTKYLFAIAMHFILSPFINAFVLFATFSGNQHSICNATLLHTWKFVFV